MKNIKSFSKIPLYRVYVRLAIWGSLALFFTCGSIAVYDFFSRVLLLQQQVQTLENLHRQQGHYQEETEIWLKRFARKQWLLNKQLCRSYINPPHRGIIQKLLEETAPGIQIIALHFEAEQRKTLDKNVSEQSKNDGTYTFCHQNIHIRFACQDDRSVVLWVRECQKIFPGILALRTLRLKRNPSSSQPLAGEILFQWAFLRL